MVTTVTGTKDAAVGARKATGLGPRPPGGNGSHKNGGPDKGPGRGGGSDGRWSPDRYRVGVMIGIASILMMFTALVSAYVFRAGLPTSIDWSPIGMPRVLLLSTALIVASSLTMALAHGAAVAGRHASRRRWLSVTLALGLGFLASQLAAWRQLVAEGIYLASNPHSSFFYVLTGLHGLHLLGGILALSYLRFRRAPKDAGVAEEALKGRVLTGVVGIYWHFMDALWVFLFVLLFFWR